MTQLPRPNWYLDSRRHLATRHAWPKAHQQYLDWVRCIQSANDHFGCEGRIPDELHFWWINTWANDFHVHLDLRPCQTLADLQALLDFCELLDRIAFLSNSSDSQTVYRDLEFTPYDQPFVFQGEPLRLLNTVAVEEWFHVGRFPPGYDGPRPAERFEKPCRTWLACDEILQRLDFLGDCNPLTEGQRNCLYRIGVRRPRWARTTFGEVWGHIRTQLRIRLQTGVDSHGDRLNLPRPQLDQARPFADNLRTVKNWMLEARKGTLPEGPFEPFGFRYLEVEIDFKDAPRRYQLLSLLWELGSPHPHPSRDEGEVLETIWPDDDQAEGNLKNLCVQVNRDFGGRGIELRVSRGGGKIQLVPTSR
jgi:hypothetical protein